MEHLEGNGRLKTREEAGSINTRRERYQEIVKTTISELYGNALYWDFFKSFNEDSVHDFIIEYATKKAWYIANKERVLAKKEGEQFLYRDLAEKSFWEIQQKKLFNLQCEWRAGLIQIEGIEVTRDFLCWEKAITKCPFLEPVTISEFQLYCEYMDSEFYEEKSWLYNWQDYDVFRNHVTDDLLPSWYRFFDSKRGTDYLQLLPDKKGEEEKMILELWKQHNTTSEVHDEIELEMVTRPMPNLYLNYETLDFFIRTFESRNLINIFEAAESKPEDARKEEELQEALRILNKAPYGIQLPEKQDWRESIINGAQQFKKQQILDNLSFVYDEYLFRIQNGISFSDLTDSELYSDYLDNAILYRLKIKEGLEIQNSNKK